MKTHKQAVTDIIRYHAPGPWLAEYCDKRWMVFDASGDTLCECVAGNDGIKQTARLIAAAPQLLAACEIASKRFQQLGLDWLGKDGDPLEAAINVALGVTGGNER